jgi:FtsZ-binding cell division protein ZapB
VSNPDIYWLITEIERLQLADRQWADHVKRLSEEIERLRTANSMLAEERDAWRQAFHRAHEVRGESLKACPLCKVGRDNCPSS